MSYFRNMKKWFFCSVLIHLIFFIQAQDVDLPYDAQSYHEVDRFRIITKNQSNLHTSLRMYDYKDLQNVLQDSNQIPSTAYDQKLIADLLQTVKSNHDSSRPIEKFWHHFYQNPAYLYSKYDENYRFQINPVIYFGAGKSSEKEGLVLQNTRGLKISGVLNDMFYFYTDIIETQRRFPLYVDQYISEREAIPQNGFYKPYKSNIFDFTDGFDYLNSTGYLSVRVTDNVGFQLGHGRHFIGNGRRSVLLSDFSNNAFYLQADWKFWKIHYRNIWSELRPESAVFGGTDDVLPRKYTATHHLSINLLPNLNFGLFETVVFHRSNQFELGYLNPIILYRTVEQSANSPDNVLLGIDLRWDIWQTISLYGQVVFDEFKLDELILDNQGWWANKYAMQLGLQYINVGGINGLDWRLEYNQARPYTYTHRDSSASYSHYNLPLAHPLGANFREWLTEIRYPIGQNLLFEVALLWYNKGEDGEGENWGGNILISHNSREQDYQNSIGQGLSNKVFLTQLSASYRIFNGLYAEAEIWRRSSSLLENDEWVYNLALRYHFNPAKLRI